MVTEISVNNGAGNSLLLSQLSPEAGWLAVVRTWPFGMLQNRTTPMVRHSSAPAKAPAKFQSDMNILTPDLTSLRLYELLQ